MKKLIAVGGLAVAGLLVSGCSTGQGESPFESVKVIEVDLSDRTVECVTWKVGDAGGLQCDFEGEPRGSD